MINHKLYRVNWRWFIELLRAGFTNEIDLSQRLDEKWLEIHGLRYLEGMPGMYTVMSLRDGP